MNMKSEALTLSVARKGNTEICGTRHTTVTTKPEVTELANLYLKKECSPSDSDRQMKVLNLCIQHTGRS